MRSKQCYKVFQGINDAAVDAVLTQNPQTLDHAWLKHFTPSAALVDNQLPLSRHGFYLAT